MCVCWSLDTLLQHPFPQKKTRHKNQPSILAQDTKNGHVSAQPHTSPTIPNAMAILMRLCLITWTLSWPVTGDVSPEKVVNKTQLKRQRLGV